MHQFWDSVYKHDTFYRFKIDKGKRFKLTLEVFRDIFKIYPRVKGQDFDALPTDEEIVSFLRDLGRTGEIHSLNDVVVDKMHQPWRTFAALINRSLSGKTTGLDKLHFSRTQILWGYVPSEECGLSTPLKKARKFKKPTSPKLTTVPVSTEEPIGKSKRETLEMLVSKKKENVEVARGKGIELLSDVALKEDAQFKEVRRKSMRDFHKTHPSGSGTATKPTPSAALIKPFVTNEGTGVKPWVPNVTEEESSESETESWGNDDDDNNNNQDSRSEGSDQDKDSDDDKTLSDNEDESDPEHETDANESGLESDQEVNEEDEDDEEEVKDELLKTPSNDSDDEDETKITDKAEGDEDEEMDYTTSLLYDDVDIRLNEQVDTDKGFLQEEGTDAAMTNVQQGNENSEISQVIEYAHVTLSTIPQKTDVPVSSSSHSSDLAAKFLNFSDIPTTEAEIVSPLNVPVHHEMFKESLEDVVLAKESSQPQSSYEAAATLTKFELKKILIDKMDKRKTGKDAAPATGPKAKESQSGSSKGDKSQSKSSGKSVQSEEPEFEVVDSDMPQDQEENLGKDDEEPKENVASKHDRFTKPTQPQEPTDPDWNVDKTPQQGQNQSWLMTLASSAEKPSKTFDELMSTPIDFSAFIMNGLKINNLTQETLLGPAFRLLKGTRSNYAELEYDFEEFMSRNHQKVPVDYFFNNDLKYLQGVAYDKHALWGILHWREQRKSFYGYAQGLQSTHDVYSTKCILAVTQVEKRVKDLQLRVDSYQKKINVTKPETAKSGIRKKDPYTPYQDPQGFIYVDNNRRNRLIRLDELYKFSDRTLTGLRTLLDYITKNIQMEYLPKRRWSTLEKKRANIMIKAIDKQLKERRLMRSLEKFVGGRHYGTDLRLLQQTI
ncbi:retrovirus-related pol polyprotein from transposon TNT 1-94 [Tanacetum coccineum]